MQTTDRREDIADCPDEARHLVQQIVDGGDFELPLLPEAASQLLGMCNEPDCPPQELAACIRRDQAIATHVLRLANSTAFYSGAEIVSLQQAIARLGLHQIRLIVLVISCQSRVFDVQGFDAEVRNSFRRSLGAALFNQEIARTRRLNVEDAFLCGLLHDIGRPVLLQALVDVQKKQGFNVDRQSGLEAVDQHRIEVGTKIIESWKLPRRVAQIVSDQLPADASIQRQEAKALCLAIKMTDSLFDDEFEADAIVEHEMVEPLNLYPSQLASILGKRDAILDLIGSM